MGLKDIFSGINLLKDSLGNVAKVMNYGRLIGEYTYDAWGNVTTKIYDDIEIDTIDRYVINNNPFRYKGYYYDIETNLYYCNARYYDPTIYQWLSPDSLAYLDLESINGMNLYAYCANDPINKYDPTGRFPWLILVAAILLFTPVGGMVAQVATSIVSYAGMAVSSIFDEDIRNDMNAIGWNPFNTNESATLNSSKVSFYKGVPVFRTAAGGRSGSFGAIFLTKGSGVDALRHERGHNWQLMMMGIANYGLMIGLPSWLNEVIDHIMKDHEKLPQMYLVV